MSNKKSRFQQAFKENFNLVGLAGAAALSFALLNPLPLLVGIVAEAAYLLFVPDSKWYESRLAARFDAEVVQRRDQVKAQVFPQISDRVRQRFDRLEGIRGQITAQPGMEKQDWFRQVLRKLDYLLEKFLLFASKEVQFRTYLANVHEEVVGSDGPGQGSGGRRERKKRRDWSAQGDEGASVTIRLMPGGRGSDERALPAAIPDGPGRNSDRWITETVAAIQRQYDEDIADINVAREREEEESTRAVLDKRVEVLEQRKEYVGKIGRILTNLGHQMELLEDSFGLINDQMRARSPEQVLADIEGVVYQTDSMTKLLDELAPYDQAIDRLAA